MLKIPQQDGASYRYKAVAKILPKIIFNKRNVENFVFNGKEAFKYSFNNNLVFFKEKIPCWFLEYTDINGTFISQKYYDYNELQQHLVTLETSIDSISIIEGSEY